MDEDELFISSKKAVKYLALCCAQKKAPYGDVSYWVTAISDCARAMGYLNCADALSELSVSADVIATRIDELNEKLKAKVQNLPYMRRVKKKDFWLQVAFLDDMLTELNKLNKMLQGDFTNIFDLVDKLSMFGKHLQKMKDDLSNKIFQYFPSCKEMGADKFEKRMPEMLESIEGLINAFETRFEKYKFLHEDSRHLLSKEEVILYLLIFPTSYKCEQCFSHMGNILTSVRHSLGHDRLLANLRLALSKYEKPPTHPNSPYGIQVELFEDSDDDELMEDFHNYYENEIEGILSDEEEIDENEGNEDEEDESDDDEEGENDEEEDIEPAKKRARIH